MTRPLKQLKFIVQCLDFALYLMLKNIRIIRTEAFRRTQIFYFFLAKQPISGSVGRNNGNLGLKDFSTYKKNLEIPEQRALMFRGLSLLLAV
jgi:hypothetical protein